MKSPLKTRIFNTVLFFVITSSIAQVGIGTTTPNSSSMLEINSNSKGLLIPRINLVSIVDTATITSPATSLLVFNTNNAINFGSGVGYYFWTGTQWEKLQTSSDDLWSRNSTGSLFPKTLSDNIGIGTNNPFTKLHVVSNSSNPVIFDGGSSLYISFAENGVYRGYFGSFAGNPEDIELGTYSGNLGAVHLTTNNTPKLTVINDGNVGIGTTSPSEKLEINGKIKITDGNQAAGKILSSDINGVGTWVNSTATTSAVAGVFAGGGASFGTTISVGSPASPLNYCNVYIDLPRGKWMVFGTYLLAGNSILASGQSCFIRSTFCLSNTVAAANPDIISGGLISGIISGPNQFGIANGQTIINNSSSPVNGPPKRYYMWSNIEKFGTTPTTFGMSGVGSNFWSENQLFAIPMN